MHKTFIADARIFMGVKEFETLADSGDVFRGLLRLPGGGAELDCELSLQPNGELSLALFAVPEDELGGDVH